MPRLPVNDRNLRPDQLAHAALQSGVLTVDPDEGAVYREGWRVEHLHKKTGYGRVQVAEPLRWAMAHRVVWTAVNGLIPPRLEINHANGKRWDNRLVNLELVLPEGNQRHWRGEWYAKVPGPEWLEFVAAVREETGEERAYDPYSYRWLQHITKRGA